MTREDFEERIIGMQDTLYRISSTLLAAPCDREDAIQECIFKALDKREKLRDDRAMQSWVIRILINECYGVLRQNRRMSPQEQLPERVMEEDADPEVFQALFALENKFRLPMVLYYVEGYSTQEIARMMRLPCGTIRSRLARARKRIKEELLKEEAAERG